MTYSCPRCGAGNNPKGALVCSFGEPIDRRDTPEVMIEFIGPPQSEPSILDTNNRSGHGRTWIGAAAIVAMAVVALASSRGEFDSLPVSEVAVLRVTFSVRTAAQFLLDAGAVGDSGYRRYGIRTGEGWEVDA